MNEMKRRDGFEGEKYIAIPELALRKVTRGNSLMQQLYVTYIGYFPKATYHYRERLKGCKDNILIYCIRGRGWFKINNQHFDIGPNEYIMVPSTKVHMKYGADETDPWTIYWVHFSGKDMEAFNKDFGIDLYQGAKEIMFNEKGLELWEAMYNNLALGYSEDNLTNTNLCLYHFLATFLYPEKHTNVKIQDEKNMIKDIILYMQDNINEKLTIEQLAKRIDFSTSHFSSLFKKATGMSPLDYFIHLKMQKACIMLYTTEVKVKDIAIGLGYDDPFHFSRIFKKNMNVSPNQYRILRRNKGEDEISEEE
ncbi:transcriptional regulator [Pedobacter sp. BAL39]|nr:transcriptional regulator [Pedobacter sp. BAL39]